MKIIIEEHGGMVSVDFKGPVNRALPLPNCAVAQACRRLQIGAAQPVQLAKLVNF